MIKVTGYYKKSKQSEEFSNSQEEQAEPDEQTEALKPLCWHEGRMQDTYDWNVPEEDDDYWEKLKR